MYVDALAGAIVGHMAGDFLLQNDWMALNKKQSDRACFVHVLLYTSAVMLFSGWFAHESAGWIAFAVALPHYIIDRTQFVKGYMATMRQRKFAEPPMSPWSMIAVDNSMHFVCLWAVAFFMGS